VFCFTFARTLRVKVVVKNSIFTFDQTINKFFAKERIEKFE